MAIYEKVKKGTEREEDIESKQRRQREAVHIWKQNYGHVMSSCL
jgi:hypothetical protein